jgi:hypothetical protein
MSFSDLGDRHSFSTNPQKHLPKQSNKQTNKQNREREREKERERDTHVCQESCRLAVAVAPKSLEHHKKPS